MNAELLKNKTGGLNQKDSNEDGAISKVSFLIKGTTMEKLY